LQTIRLVHETPLFLLPWRAEPQERHHYDDRYLRATSIGNTGFMAAVRSTQRQQATPIARVAPERSADGIVVSTKLRQIMESVVGSTTDKIKGAANEAIGKAKQGIGEAVGSDKMKGEGAMQEAKGHGQQALGDAKQAAKDAANKAAEFANKKL
jgi:uncharacterized protein YjbJ (UPF0337 family)